MVPRLDDRVRPTPSTTHRENHPRQVQLTRAKHGSGCLTTAAASSSPDLYCSSIRVSVPIISLCCCCCCWRVMLLSTDSSWPTLTHTRGICVTRRGGERGEWNLHPGWPLIGQEGNQHHHHTNMQWYQLKPWDTYFLVFSIWTYNK